MLMDIPAPEFHDRRTNHVGPSFVTVGGRFEDLKVGDVVRMPWVNNHGASIQITKFNRKTLAGVEIKGSYSAGRQWRINPNYDSLQIDPHYMTDERLAELKALWG
jgi:hypothetical protein